MALRGYRERGTHHFKEEDRHQHLEGPLRQCPYVHALHNHPQHLNLSQIDFLVAGKGSRMSHVLCRSVGEARDYQMNQR